MILSANLKLTCSDDLTIYYKFFKFYSFYYLLLVLYVFLSVKCSRNDIISAYCKRFTERYRNKLFVFVFVLISEHKKIHVFFMGGLQRGVKITTVTLLNLQMYIFVNIYIYIYIYRYIYIIFSSDPKKRC